jgi:hypothetical protein
MANSFLEGSVLALPKNFGASGDAPSSQNPFHQSSIASRCHLRFYDTNLFGAYAPPTNYSLNRCCFVGARKGRIYSWLMPLLQGNGGE